RLQDGRRGFRMAVGGGTAILCKSGTVLFDFVPANEILDAAEAVIRVFHRFGDYKHKQRNRLKFLVKSIGWERFRAECENALAEVRQQGGTPLPFDPEHSPADRAPEWDRPAPPSVETIARRVMAAELRGPGIHPETHPV